MPTSSTLDTGDVGPAHPDGMKRRTATIGNGHGPESSAADDAARDASGSGCRGDARRSAVAAANPVPWARAQMAFTLAFHIILVPLGVSWAFDDADRQLPRHQARRRRRAAAGPALVEVHGGDVRRRRRHRDGPLLRVRPAVAAVHGAVGRGVRRARSPSRASSSSSRRSSSRSTSSAGAGSSRGRTSGPASRSPVAGIFGSISVVAANAWMNSPQGVTLDSAGKVVDVDPIGVIFNDAMPLMAAHMVVAAYLVGGFLIASVYAVGMLRGRRDRYHRLGFIIAFTVAAIATPVQMGVGRRPGSLGLQQPAGQVRRDRDGAEDQQRRARDPARPPQLRTAGGRRHPDPGPGLVAVGPEHRHGRPSSRASTASRPTSDRPIRAGQRRPPRVGHHGRPRHAAVPAHAVVLGVVDLPTRHAAKQVVPACRRRRRASSRW